MPEEQHEEAMDLELILAEVGHFGLFQLKNYFLILIGIVSSAIWYNQYIFNAAAVPYRCVVPECEAEPPTFGTAQWGAWALPAPAGDCARAEPLAAACEPASFHANRTVPCHAWLYEHQNSIVAEFDLACQEWKRTLVGSVHSAGVFFALPLTAYISDTYGRRLAFIMNATLGSVVGTLRAFSINYPMYMALEFLEAALGAGLYSAGFVLALEMVGRDKRVMGGNIISCVYAMGQVLMALLAWELPYWRSLTLAAYAPFVFLVLYFFVLEESVRWLLSKGRNEEAAKIIYKAAAMNKRKLSPETVRLLSNLPGPDEKRNEETEPETETESQNPDKHVSLYKQVLRSKTLVTRLMICSTWWVSITFIYYGLSINAVSLAGNRYVNYMIISLVEIPGYTLSTLMLDRFGRKSSIICAFFICAAALTTLPFVADSLAWLRVSLTMAGKLAISMAFSSIYIYTSELIPTELRQSLLGACSMMGRVGSLLAPQTPLLKWTLILSNVGKLMISMIYSSIYIYTAELFPTSCRQSLLNLCSMVGRIGSIIAPQTPLLQAYWVSLPFMMFGAMATISGLLMLLTPETLRARLPDTVREAEEIAVAPCELHHQHAEHQHRRMKPK